MKKRFFEIAKLNNVSVVTYSSFRGDMGWHVFNFTVTFWNCTTSFTESYIVGKGEKEKRECLQRFEDKLNELKNTTK